MKPRSVVELIIDMLLDEICTEDAEYTIIQEIPEKIQKPIVEELELEEF